MGGHDEAGLLEPGLALATCLRAFRRTGRVLSRRDAESFARLYDEQIWHVYGFFGYHLSSREQAEDLTQLTFEKTLKAWRRFDPSKASATTWLLAIARNTLIDHYQRDRASRHEPMPEDEAGQARLGHTPPDESGLGLAPDLEAALNALAQRERELIALRFGGDLTGPEIADVTGLSLANVQQILSRALRRMRSELADEPSGSPTGAPRP